MKYKTRESTCDRAHPNFFGLTVTVIDFLHIIVVKNMCELCQENGAFNTETQTDRSTHYIAYAILTMNIQIETKPFIKQGGGVQIYKCSVFMRYFHNY